jgi:uncharacterized membrane protein
MMTLSGNQLKKRIDSIDVLRGIVMVVMALDHVRDYFHISANVNNPLDLATTTPLLFFTRWITHFCAPVFVFLSGISIYLQSLRKTKKQLSKFLIKRGLWLILIEAVIVSFAWSFNPHYNFIFVQVIWTIGISMFFLGLLIYLPEKLILLLGLIIVFGHNILDIPESAPGFKAGFWWDLLHHGFFSLYPYAENHSIFIVYPFVPWLGLMMIGYYIGILYTENFTPERRKYILNITGAALILFFILLRALNIYGDPVKWSIQKNLLYTILSFIDVHKYPPSLLYMCITIGPSLLLLTGLEKFNNSFTDKMQVYGRVALFYYIIHLYLIHFITSVFFFSRGHSFSDATNVGHLFPFYFVTPGEGFGLAGVYITWLLIVIALYPLCKWYDRYKLAHREKVWLSYL